MARVHDRTLPKRKSTVFKFDTAQDCPDAEKLHTREPVSPHDYIGWHAWAKKKSRTHRQARCPTCGFFSVWGARKELLEALKGFTPALDTFEGLRVAVVGSRDYRDLRAVRKFVIMLTGCKAVVTGDARGVDKAARMTAKRLEIDLQVHEADWGGQGNAAGPARNALVVQDADALVAFWDGTSRGTLDAIKKAKAKKIPVKIVR